MKTLNSFPKNNKISSLVCLILLVVHSPLSSQTKIVVLATAENLYFVLPVVCVLVLAVFLMTAFLKQKNH